MNTHRITFRHEFISPHSGKKYVLAQDNQGNWACSCPGWVNYHKPCRHIKEFLQLDMLDKKKR